MNPDLSFRGKSHVKEEKNSFHTFLIPVMMKSLFPYTWTVAVGSRECRQSGEWVGDNLNG